MSTSLLNNALLSFLYNHLFFLKIFFIKFRTEYDLNMSNNDLNQLSEIYELIILFLGFEILP